MGVEQRPYVGTWQLGRQQVVQHTPDTLVYVNGDSTVPGCPKCDGRIDLQEFITQVSVEAGTDPGGASASFTMSIPLHHTDSFARDAKFILRPGLEVHIYMRGYFPVKGLYKNLAEPSLPDSVIPTGQNVPKTINPVKKAQADVVKANIESKNLASEDELAAAEDTLDATDYRYASRNGYLSNIYEDEATSDAEYHDQLTTLGDNEVSLQATAYSRDRLMAIADSVSKQTGIPSSMVWGIMVAESAGNPEGVGSGTEFGMGQMTQDQFGSLAVVEGDNKKRLHWKHSDNVDPQYALWAVGYTLDRTEGAITDEDAVDFWFASKNVTPSALQRSEYLASFQQAREEIQTAQAQGRLDKARLPGDNNPPTDPPTANANRAAAANDIILKNKLAAQAAGRVQSPTDVATLSEEVPLVAVNSQSLLAQQGLGGSGIEDVMAYPYYHVFHGVVTQVSHAWSGGTNTVSIQCSSMLHFWNYHTVSTNASVFGARPKNSKLKTSMVGHNFTGMHPYQIIHSLHTDMAGAAGGVGYVMGQKTNQTAKSSVGGESLYSLNIRYWKQRFDTEMNKLRLFGATGELFSTAQAAFLGTTSSAALTRLIRNRFTDPVISRKGHKGRAGLMEQSQAVGLGNDRRLEALTLGQSRPTSKNSTKFELNLVEMQAFVSDVGGWGSIGLFESTYASKIDIVGTVTELTGFEFYQDVDGDFVFKPPLYNMDTSSSRVYRIEDIDIISIDFNEKEPQATYITVKGSQGKNIEYGVGGEWGHKGQYIDYRLVAKFGWRPADYEAAYFNDSKSMFFSAVNRMDILNAPSNGASLTIPIRPELRPGYPVYIKYLDCFYYCSNFSHSYSVGGQCTTSLELNAKRAKFYAPGKVGVSAPQGIKSIDLSNTILPERPLEVIGRDGRPRLSGFPNVVMALDPEDINELFFVVGTDIENIGDPIVLKALLRRGLDLGVVSRTERGTYRIKVETGASAQGDKQGQWVEFFLQDPALPAQSSLNQKNEKKKKGNTGTPDDPVNLEAAAQHYKERQRSASKRKARLEKSIRKLISKINRGGNKLLALEKAKSKGLSAKNKTKNDEEITATKKGLAKFTADKIKQESAVDLITAGFDKSLSESDKMGVSYLVKLMKVVGEEYLSNNPDVADLESTVNLLDLLSDKKATFSNGKQPGSYRYYSASHPDPEQQGQKLVRYVQTKGGGKEVEKKNPFLESVWQGTEVEGYLETVPVSYPGAPHTEAALGPVKPTRGIRIMTSNKTRPRGEVVPTSEIRELSFSVQESSLLKKKSSTETVTTISDLSAQAQKAIRNRFTLKAVRAPTASAFLKGSSPESLFKAQWVAMAKAVGTAVELATDVLTAPDKNGKTSTNIAPSYPEIDFPSVIPVGRSSISVGDLFGASLFRDNKVDGLPEWGPSGSANQTMAQAADKAGNGFSKVFFGELNRTRQIWVSRLGAAKYDLKQSELAAGTFNTAVQSLLGIPAQGRLEQKKLKTRRKHTTFTSPVFPVSDAQGYEVMGSYRYGRGVTIEPQNIFQGMRNIDVLSLLDKQTVIEVVNAFVRRKPQQLLTPVMKNGKVDTDKQGNPKMRPVKANASTAQNILETKVLEQLRQNLTNKQIFDLFGMDSDDPNAIEGGFRNWIADKLKDGVQKVPVINAAYSLADLKLRRDKKVCSCKAAEADVLLDAFANQEFVQFITPGDSVPTGIGSGAADKATQYVSQLVARSSASWAESQDALRGAVLDKGGSPLIRSGSSAINALTEQDTNRAARALQASILEAFGGEDS